MQDFVKVNNESFLIFQVALQNIDYFFWFYTTIGGFRQQFNTITSNTVIFIKNKIMDKQ